MSASTCISGVLGYNPDNKINDPDGLELCNEDIEVKENELIEDISIVSLILPIMNEKVSNYKIKIP